MAVLPNIEWRLQDDASRERVTAAVEELLRVLPAGDLVGLSRIVLKNASEDNRQDRRRTTHSRGRKVPLNQAAGFYNEAWQGDSANIVLHLDRIYKGTVFPRQTLPLLMPLSLTLYHEVGHHVAKCRQLEHREPENDADRYGLQMQMRLLRKRWYLFAAYLIQKLLIPSTWRQMWNTARLYNSGKKGRAKV